MLTLALLVVLAAAEVDQVAAPVFYAGNEELRAYLMEAAENNPALRAMHEEWLAALERIPQATSLDDPKLSFTYFLQSDTKDYGLGLMQEFPWFGTLRARGDMAAAEAEAALQRLYAARNQVFAEVKKAYFEYAYLDENLRITESQEELLRYMEEVVRAKYAVGMAMEDELLRIQIEQSMVQDRKQGLLQMRPALAAQLTTALGREAAEPLDWPQSCALPPNPPSADVVMARIQTANPELLAMDHMIESRGAAIRMARKMGRPEFGLEIGFERMKPMAGMPKTTAVLDAAGAANNLVTGMNPGPVDALMNANTLAMTRDNLSTPAVEDDVMLSFSLSLPIWRKRVKAGIAEAQHKEAGASHDKRRMTLAMESEARMALFGVQDAVRRVSLYEDDLLPKARLTYESVQASYGVNAGASFLDVLESVRRLLDFDLEKAAAVRDLQNAAADLERLMGGPWVPAPAR